MVKRLSGWTLAAAMLALLLGGCTGTEMKESVAGGFKNWCKQAQKCTVRDDSPGGGWAYGPHNP